MYSYRQIVLLICFLNSFATPLYAVDIDGDGKAEIFTYYFDSSTLVAQSVTGEYVSDVYVPPSLLDKTPIVFAGRSDGQLVVYSLFVSGKKLESTLYRIDRNGGLLSKHLGPLQGGAIMMYDVNNDSDTDLIFIRKTGEVATILSPFLSTERTSVVSAPRLRRKSLVTLTRYGNEPYLSVYTTLKRKRKTVFVSQSLFSPLKRVKKIVRRKIRTQLYPLLSARGFVSDRFVLPQRKRTGIISRFTDYNIAQGLSRSYRIAPSTSLVADYYSEIGSEHQVIAVGKTIRLLDLQNEATPLIELSIADEVAQNGAFLSAPFVSFRIQQVSKNQGCTYQQDGSDGPGGFLLKASDSDGNIVVLLPAQLPEAEVSLTTSSGKMIERLSYTGRSNGFRGTYRGAYAPTSYPQQLNVRVEIQDQSVCYRISNAHIRND